MGTPKSWMMETDMCAANSFILSVVAATTDMGAGIMKRRKHKGKKIIRVTSFPGKYSTRPRTTRKKEYAEVKYTRVQALAICSSKPANRMPKPNFDDVT